MKRAASFGLRLDAPGPAWLTALALLLVYAATMARGLTFYDSPELALVAHELGVGHPIGQPTHTLLGFVFAHLPVLGPHVGLTLLSALSGALCAVPAWSLSEALAPDASPRASLVRAAAIVLTGLGAVAWEPASRVEVYTLATFLALFATARLVRFGPSLAVGVALGLAAGAHALIAVVETLALLPMLLVRDPSTQDRRAAVRAIGLAAAGLALGGLVYVYVPIAGAGHPERFAWGAPNDAASLLAYLRGADYAHNQGISLAEWLDHALDLARWGIVRGALVPTALGVAALFALRRESPSPRARRLFYTSLIVLTLSAAFVAANVVFHPDVPDYCGYYLCALWIAASGLAALAVRGLTGRRALVLAAALPALALLMRPTHLMEVRDDPSLAEVLAHDGLDEAPRGAIVIVEADHWVAPLLYAQEVERRRTDVVIVAVGLASSSWYWEHLFARHPDLSAMPLAGPGGRVGRIRRLLDANPDRATLTESWALASALGTPVGCVGILLRADCREPIEVADRASARIASTAPLRREALEVAGRVDEARGEALWRLGYPRAARDALLAGLPASLGLAAPQGDMLDRGPPLTGPLPADARPSAIHDVARNLTLAAMLLGALGQRGDAVRLADRASEMGLDLATMVAQRLRAGR
ncbi:MAG: DUF2723 domain-containing protein [Sandaracinaceae bacterium]